MFWFLGGRFKPPRSCAAEVRLNLKPRGRKGIVERQSTERNVFHIYGISDILQT